MTDEVKETTAEQTPSTPTPSRLIEPEGDDDGFEGLANGQTAENKEDQSEDDNTTVQLTPEQIAAISRDPNTAAAILQGEVGQQALNALIQEVLGEVEEESRYEQARAAAMAPVQEAVRRGQEDGDWSELGQMMAQRWQQQQILGALSQRIRPQIENDVRLGILQEVDTAVESAFGDQLNELSQEELASLRRSNFQSDADFYSATMKAVRGKIESRIKADLENEVSAARQAMAATATAGRARQDGLGVLPGAISGEGVGAVSIGSLVRQALTATGGEDDSD